MNTNKKLGITNVEFPQVTALLVDLQTLTSGRSTRLTSYYDLTPTMELSLKLKDASSLETELNSLLLERLIPKKICECSSSATTPSTSITKCGTQSGQRSLEFPTPSEPIYPVTSQAGEVDPLGKDQHESGVKLDAGKNRLDLVLGSFCRALEAVGRVGTDGARKYTDNGWLSVPDGIGRYNAAALRHYLQDKRGEAYDGETGHLHLAHRAWNALAALELTLREQETNK